MRSNLHLRFVVAVILLILLPAAAAQAAPKKVRFSFSTATASVSEGAGTYNLVVQRALNTRTTASVTLAVDPSSTAVPGTDYTFTNPGTITFNPGETRKSFPVAIVDDQQFNRPNKKIVFKLSGAPAGSQLKNNP